MPLTVLLRRSGPKADHARSSVEVDFEDGVVRIGRSGRCELRLRHPSVSEAHAVLRPGDAGAWTVTDDTSRNGTWVNGVKLSANAARTVRDGDLLRVGAIWLELRITRQGEALGNRSTRELALEILDRVFAVQSPTVTVVEGPDLGKALVLSEEERPYTVGRSARCDLALVDRNASREHVRLFRRGLDVFVSDGGAKNGILLGEDPVQPSQSARWSPAFAVRAGSTVLALDVPQSVEDVAALVAPPPPLGSEPPSTAPSPPALSEPQADERTEETRQIVSQDVLTGKAATPPRPFAGLAWREIALVIGAALVLVLSIVCGIWIFLS